MASSNSELWSLCIGRWRGVELRLHILLPLLALVGFAFVLETEITSPQVLCWGLLILFLSVGLAEVLRWTTAVRLGGRADAIVFGPISGLSRIHLPEDPPAHIATGLAAPTTFLVTMVLAGCALALAGDNDVLRLLNPIDPQVEAQPQVTIDPQANRFGTTSTILPIIGQLAVFINWCLLLVSLLPIEPCAGADMMRGVLWPIVGLSTARSLTSLVAFGAGVISLLLALVLSQDPTITLVPAWFPMATVALVLFYGGFRPYPHRRADLGLAIDELDSDDELWVTGQWHEESYETVLVEQMQDKQQETIDRKRKEREASEDARVDDILARLNSIRFDELSEEDRAILKRASRRYRRRRSVDEES